MADEEITKSPNKFKDDADAALTWRVHDHVTRDLLDDEDNKDGDGHPMHESSYCSHHYHRSIDGPQPSAQESTDAVIPKRVSSQKF